MTRIDWGGCPALPLSRRKLRSCARTVQSETACYITATTNGVHSSGSYHYSQRAIDWGSNRSDNRPEKKAQRLLLDKYGAKAFRELLGPLGWYVKDGVKHEGHFPQHGDHLHAAI